MNQNVVWTNRMCKEVYSVKQGPSVEGVGDEALASGHHSDSNNTRVEMGAESRGKRIFGGDESW